MYRTSGNSSANLKFEYFLATYCVYGSLSLPWHICVLVMQALCIYVNSVAHCGNDGLFFGLTVHLCGQFEVLKMDLAKVEFEEVAYRKKIRLLVKRHCELTTLVNGLEQTFNVIILVQLLMSAFLICVEGKAAFISLLRYE